MSTEATAGNPSTTSATHEPTTVSSPSKGKGKGKDVHPHAEEEEEDDDEDEEEEEEEGEDEEDEELEEDALEEIDPSAIRSRRTRGVRVDYTSPEALAKAGLKAGEEEDEDEEMH